MVKLQEVRKDTFVISVPSMKVKKKGWKKRQELDWVEYPNGDLVLKEVK